MAQYQTKANKGLDTVDPVWKRIRQEAEEVTRREPELATFNVREHSAPRQARDRGDPPRQRAARQQRRVPAISSARPSATHLTTSLRSARSSALTSSRWSTAIRRPRAFSSQCFTTKASTPFRRTAWRIGCSARGRKDFSLYLQSRSSSVFQCDINPAAKIGPRHLPRSRDRLGRRRNRGDRRRRFDPA